MITGTCVCPGKVEGQIKLFKPGESYNQTDVVVMTNWLTQEVVEAKGAGALISSVGGITSHASIIARELNVPTLICAQIDSFKEGQKVVIDTAEEQVEIQ